MPTPPEYMIGHFPIRTRCSNCNAPLTVENNHYCLCADCLRKSQGDPDYRVTIVVPGR